MNISNAKSLEQRRPRYRDLIKIADKTIKQAVQIAKQLDGVAPQSIMGTALAVVFAAELRQYVELATQAAPQTERRVVRGESVPAGEKIVSISSHTPTSSSRATARRSTATRSASAPAHPVW